MINYPLIMTTSVWC